MQYIVILLPYKEECKIIILTSSLTKDGVSHGDKIQYAVTLGMKMSDDDSCGRGCARREIGSKHGWFLRVKAIATDADATEWSLVEFQKANARRFRRSSLAGSLEATSL